MPEVQYRVAATEGGTALLSGSAPVVSGTWSQALTIPTGIADGATWWLGRRGVDDAGNAETWKWTQHFLSMLPQALGTLSSRPSWTGAFQSIFGAAHDPITTQGDQPVRTPTRTVVLTDLAEYTGNGSTDNPTAFGRKWMGYFGNRVGYAGTWQAGDRLVVPAGTHTSAGNLDIPGAVQNVDIVLGSTTGAAVIQHTQVTSGTALMDRHAIRILGNNSTEAGSAGGITVRAASRQYPPVTETIGAVGRTGLNQQGNTMLLIDPYAHDIQLQDIHGIGARAAGFFGYRAKRVWLNRCRSTETWADAFHFTNGCEDILLTDCISERSGDDGAAPVRYSGEADASSTRRFADVRHRITGTGHGRGFVDICNSDIYYDQVYVEGSAAAGLLVDREESSSSNPKGIAGYLAQRIHLKGCNWGAEDHGAAFFRNPSTDATIQARVESLLVEDGPNRSGIRTAGTGLLDVVVKDYKAVGGPAASQLPGGNNNAALVFDPAPVRAETTGADTTPPTLVFITPGRKATIAGTLTGKPSSLGNTGDYRNTMGVAFYAGHVRGLASAGVEVRLGDTVLGTVAATALDSSGRGVLENVDTTRFVNGPGVLSIRATSSTGKTSTVLYRPVTIQNTTPGSLPAVPSGYAGQDRTTTVT